VFSRRSSADASSTDPIPAGRGIVFSGGSSKGEPLGVIIGNDTRWNGDLAAIVCALVLREPLADYLSFTIRSDRCRDESSLIHDELSPEDWDVLKAMVEILEPFKKWTMFLQRKGAAAHLSDVHPAYD